MVVHCSAGITEEHIHHTVRRLVMKRLLLVATASLIVTSGIMAQNQYFSTAERHKEANLKDVEKRYVQCLGEENAGVVQSALAHAVHMKLLFPAREFPDLTAKVNSLAATSGLPAIRYRAYLSSLVFDNPALFTVEHKAAYEDPDDLFSALATRVQVTLLGKGEGKYVRAE